MGQLKVFKESEKRHLEDFREPFKSEAADNFTGHQRVHLDVFKEP